MGIHRFIRIRASALRDGNSESWVRLVVFLSSDRRRGPLHLSFLKSIFGASQASIQTSPTPVLSCCGTPTTFAFEQKRLGYTRPTRGTRVFHWHRSTVWRASNVCRLLGKRRTGTSFSFSSHATCTGHVFVLYLSLEVTAASMSWVVDEWLQWKTWAPRQPKWFSTRSHDLRQPPSPRTGDRLQ